MHAILSHWACAQIYARYGPWALDRVGLPYVIINVDRLAMKMSLLLALIYLGYALISLTLAQNDKACPATGTQSTCVCQTDSGLIIDLRPLAKTDGTAKYVILIKHYRILYNIILFLHVKTYHC